MALMAGDPHAVPHDPHREVPGAVEMPRPMVWPMVLSLGLVLLALGVVTNLAISATGLVLLAVGVGGWVGQMLPGRGHVHEPLAPPQERPRLPAGAVGTVSRLGTGMPGYRLRLPVEMHPVSAGVWGGVAGGLLMVVPALIYGVVSGHGLLYPVNLLAGMVLPGLDRMTPEELGQFHPGLFALGAVIHVAMCLVIGLLYGVLMPTLPEIPRPIAWGGLLMPLLWTGVSGSLLAVVNPVMGARVDWPWFIVSQFVFGVVAAGVVLALRNVPPVPAGIAGGFVGGLVMALPAVLWALAAGRGVWYPVNLLAGMALHLPDDPQALGQYHADWMAAAVAIHAGMSLAFGLLYGLLLPKLPPIPAPMAWGGLLMPLLWTGVSYALMGVVNPALERGVDWRWFILSQFVFGIAAATVVVRSEKIPIAPAGSGPARRGDRLTGTGVAP